MTLWRNRGLPSRPADFRCKCAPQYPYNEEPVSPELSVPQYGIRVERDIFVRVSDGWSVSLDVYRPDAEGTFPALFAMSSYTKELQGTDSPSLCNEAGDIEYFVSRGYIHVIADSRGSGHTGGTFEMFGEREIDDGYDIIEWITAQPWCNGNVGMIGMSYFAVVQLLIAKKNPPHLKCIFAYDPINDLYRDCCYHGGKMNIFNFLMAYFWIADHIVFSRDESGRRNRMSWWSFMKMALDFILQQHKFDDEWMRERSAFWREGKIRIPTYIGSGWEYSVGLHLRGIFDVFREAQGPKKMLVGPPHVPFRPYSSWRLESLRWYDHWLKGKDTGIDRDPPVNIWVMGKNTWRSENEWPIERTRPINLFLRPVEGSSCKGRLNPEPPEKDEKPLSYLSWPLSLGQLGYAQLVYKTPILRAEVEVTGHIVLALYASCTARDTSFFVRFCDEDDTGRHRVLTRGWLKASHREIDEKLSLPHRPFHPHRREEKLSPGEVYEFLIEIWPTSNVFMIGHRIRLEILCAESIYFDFPYAHFPSPNIGMVKVMSSPEYPSRLVLPTLDSQLRLDNSESNLLFSDEPTSYFSIRGRRKRYGPGTEFIVR